MKPKVYKKYGYWWVQWANRNGFTSNTSYHEAQQFANTVGKAQTWH